METKTARLRPRGLARVRAEGNAGDLASVIARIDGITKTIEDQSKAAAKASELIPINESIKKVTADLEQVSKDLAALKLNPAYGAAARTYKRHKKLRAFTGKDGDTLAYRSGMWLAAAVFGHARAAKWCQDNGLAIVQDKSDEQAAIVGRVTGQIGSGVFAAAGESVNTAGGFLVPAEMENTIIDLREEYGTARRLARVWGMGSDTKNVPKRESGLTAYFTGENTAATESQKGWGNVSLVAKKAAVLTRYSTELDEDSIINMADDLAQEIAYAFAVLEDACLWLGDGSPTYGGIHGILLKIIGLSSAVDAVSGHDTFLEVDATDLVNLMAKTPKFALRNARFYISQVGFSTSLARLAIAAGGNTQDTLAGPQNYRFQGYPVEIDQTLYGTSGATNHNGKPIILFGDLSLAAAFGNRRGITIMASGHRYMEFDQIGILGTERFDVNAHSLGSATVAGPLSALIAKT